LLEQLNDRVGVARLLAGELDAEDERGDDERDDDA